MNKGIKLAKEMAEEDTKLLREVLRKEETEEDVCDATTVSKLRDIEDKVYYLGEELETIKESLGRIEEAISTLGHRIG